jgi:transposase
MKIHSNAALTISQREEVHKLHVEGVSIRALADRFRVNPSTIQRWTSRGSPLDLSTAPKRRNEALSEEQKAAIKRHRQDNPQAGARTIASVLGKDFGAMSHATVGRFLQAQGLTSPIRKERKARKPLKVGKHRLQMDIQRLPAISGGHKFEYKITIIHMATRVKYSEIHPRISSKIVAETVARAVGHMPPFFFNMD